MLSSFARFRRLWAASAGAFLAASLASSCLNPRPDDLPAGGEAPTTDGARLPGPNAEDLTPEPFAPESAPSGAANSEPAPSPEDPDLLREASADEGADAGAEPEPSDAGPDAD